MSERHSTNARDHQDQASTSGASLRVTISDVEASTFLSLRIAPALAESVREVAGFDLTGGINTAVTIGNQTAARLGPDEWLLTAPAGEDNALIEAAGAALNGHFHSLVDISHRNVSIVVAGPLASAVLNAGVALDLDDAAFPAGSATRTVLGKAEIVLCRPGADYLYRVTCWRSFAPYVKGFLDVASRDAAGA